MASKPLFMDSQLEDFKLVEAEKENESIILRYIIKKNGD